MKKPRRSFKRPSLRLSIHSDLTVHIMDKVSDAALDVVQLADTEKEELSLYISGMVALLTLAILSSAPRTATRAEIATAAKMVTNTVAKKFSSSMDGLSDKEISDAVRSKG